MDKIEYNRKMVGQVVWVIPKNSKKSWMGTVHDVVDAETFLVRNIVKKNIIVPVSIYDIRQGEETV